MSGVYEGSFYIGSYLLSLFKNAEAKFGGKYLN